MNDNDIWVLFILLAYIAIILTLIYRKLASIYLFVGYNLIEKTGKHIDHDKEDEDE